MNIEIKEMTLKDLEKIKNLLITDFDNFWNYNILKEELESNFSKYIIAIKEGEIIGFAGIKVIFEEANIMNIVTKKKYRKQGIASQLLDKLINLSKKAGSHTITLEVHEENTAAINLYKKFGFEILGIRKNYYKNNKNAIIMTMKHIG